MTELPVKNDLSPAEMVENRARAAKWDVKPGSAVIVGGEVRNTFITISVPNGKDKRPVRLSENRALSLLDFDFENYRFLGDYIALNDHKNSYIEVLIRGVRFGSRDILSLPGIEVVIPGNVTEEQLVETDEDTDLVIDEASEDARRAREILPTDDWRLVLEDERREWSAEFSPASAQFLALVDGPSARLPRGPVAVTVKLRGLSAVTHDDATRMLEDHVGALLYEIDLRHNILLEMPKADPNRLGRGFLRSRPGGPPVVLPKVRYPREALSLYSYARTATSLPLLQFLAYYQVLEFFFPHYSKKDALKRVRQELLDPRFDATNEADLTRILKLSEKRGGSYGKESEQLKVTVASITDDAAVRGFITTTAEMQESLGDKKRISGTFVISLKNENQSVLDQIASRIYSIRCRIVHTKSDGDDGSTELLLPGSREAGLLGPDVQLLQFLAQKAIVAGATKL